MTDEELAALVDAYHDGSLDAAGAERIAAALAAGDADGEAFERHLAIAGLVVQANDWVEAAGMVAGLHERLRAEASPSRFLRALRRRRGRAGRRVALAGLALAAALVLGWWLLPSAATRGEGAAVAAGTVAAPDGRPRTGGRARVGDTVRADAAPADLRYADGTAITLEPGSSATLEPGDGKRLRLVAGRLAASVAPQPAGRPLVIAAGPATATVVGTRFALAATADGARIDVDEGRVAFAAAGVDAVAVAAGTSAFAVGDAGGTRIHVFTAATARDPRGFGAIPDDEGDDAPAFQRAIDAAGEDGVVLVPPGRWRLAQPLRVGNRARLLGESRARCILAPRRGGGGNLIALRGATGAAVTEIGFDGEGTVGDSLVRADGGGDLSLRWLELRDQAGSAEQAAIWLVGEQGVEPLHGGVAGAVIADCELARCGMTSAWGAAIRVGWGCSSVTIERNRIRGTGRGGILTNNGVRGLVVRGNAISGSGAVAERFGIELWGGCADAVVEDNVVDHRISVDGGVRVVLRRNRIGVDAVGLASQAVGLNGEDLVVVGQRIDGGHDAGIVSRAGGNRWHWITGNRIARLAGHGIELGNGTGLVADDNELVACGTGGVPAVIARVPAALGGNVVDLVAGAPLAARPVSIVAPGTPAAGAAAPFSVRFEDGTPVAHALWDLDEGPPQVGERIDHRFAAPGRRRVAVVVWDADGGVGTAAVDVVVAP